MEGEIRYCTSADGARIAYMIEGEGPPLLIWPGIWDSMSNIGDDDDTYEPFRKGRTCLRSDFRGVGLSQRDAPAFTLERLTGDIDALVKSARFDRFALFASHFGATPAIAYAVEHPGRVSRLILTRMVLRYSDSISRENIDAWLQLIHANWEIASQTLADLGVRSSAPDVALRGGEMLRRNMSPEGLARMISDLYETADVRGIVGDIQCPTLIVHRKDDTVFPFAAAQQAASMIPDARLLALPGSGPAHVGDDAQANVLKMRAFLDEDPETRAVTSTQQTTIETTFRTVLFTDAGPSQDDAVWCAYEEATRSLLKQHGATRISALGDGFTASFGSVSRAVECAVALERQAGIPDGVRVGLTAIEPGEEDDDLLGPAVILASRIAAKADAGEILVADTVRGLCSGKGFLFADRGEFVAKGFEEPVRVYEVRWRDG